MKRREFLGCATAALAAGRMVGGSGRAVPASFCDCAFVPQASASDADALQGYGSKVKVTNVKVFGVSISPTSDRPYVFVKLETAQA